MLNLAVLDRFYSLPGQAVQVPEERSGILILTPRFVRTAQRRSLYVEVWMINETPDMAPMVNLGVVGIITGYPDRLLDLLDR